MATGIVATGIVATGMTGVTGVTGVPMGGGAGYIDKNGASEGGSRAS